MKEKGKKKPGLTRDSHRNTNETLREQGRSRSEVAEINEKMQGKNGRSREQDKRRDHGGRPLGSMSNDELLRRARELGIENAQAMDADQLLDAIRKAQA